VNTLVSSFDVLHPFKFTIKYSKGLKTAELKEKDMPMVLDKTIIYMIS